MDVQFPRKLQGLFKPNRYKVMYGGRGSAKSWSVARALVMLGAQKPIRVLCAREVQKSIKDSVHALLKDQINALGLGGVYQILETEIRGPNGTQFLFAGLMSHTVDSIKSFEGCDICWVEEAQSVSKKSWEVLQPTIRKPGSEIWITFNPALPTDETWQRFVANPPAGAWVQEVNWSDNPWFPPELEAERLDTLARDPVGYENIWNGKPKTIIDGAIYTSELLAAASEGRIGHVPYDPALPVHTVWDIGISDATAVWMVQSVRNELRCIDHYEANGLSIASHLQELTTRRYVWGTDWLPHDARARELGTGKSIEEVMRGMGRTVQITPRLSIEDGINAARLAFPRVWFDAEKCARGIECLRSYRREFSDKAGEFKPLPVHDWASHSSDAFRYLAVNADSLSYTNHYATLPVHTGDSYAGY
ncbi:PBSX family phage terminase large subunit [Chitinilyticum litopenaei]|uniref:PBSX family phage terminase large subunit n=1 Tax=Chitinilyticum litopenaei TaxID=1121276 RepID=UPI0003FDD53C|nr:PBSX family phage terminase large subunit [Chitinilyticum litopenaei]